MKYNDLLSKYPKQKNIVSDKYSASADSTAVYNYYSNIDKVPCLS